MIRVLLIALFFLSNTSNAQQLPNATDGLQEELITVDLDKDAKQTGLFSIKSGSKNHSRLAVLIPGYPSVFRPAVENGVMISTKLSGNFLIRSRGHLADESIAILTIDCQSESGDVCSSSYQASR